MVVNAQANYQQNWKLTSSSLLDSCKTLKDVRQIHARIIKNQHHRCNMFMLKRLVRFYAKHGKFECARQLFDRMPDRDLVAWNSMIGYAQEGSLFFYLRMLNGAVFPDGFTFTLVLKACARLCLIREGMQVHCQIGKSEFGSDVFVQNSLIHMYSKCGCIEFSRQLFDRMPERDLFSWNSMINGYVKNGMMETAHQLFQKMPEKNSISWNILIDGYSKLEEIVIARQLFDQMPKRDLISWNSLIDGYTKCGRIEAAKELFDRMPEKDVVTWADMIDGYAKTGDTKTARHLFDEMPQRDVVSWNAMMSGYLQNGHNKEVLKLFHEMQIGGNFAPDQATLVIVLSAIAQLGLVNEGKKIHDYLDKNKLNLGNKLGAALIDMYSKCGNIEDAIHVFRNLHRKNIDHWNAMIGGLAIHGLGKSALQFFTEMESISFKPDDITFIAILSACSHAGLVHEGIRYFELISSVYNVEPKVQHYGCIVDILGRAGRLEEARRLIDDMHIEPNVMVWRALLGACRNHENFEIGQQTAKHLIEMDPCDPSSYVLLSNLYAGVGWWSDVSKVRKMMKERNIRKVPGCSWIELDGFVHEFVVGDKSHPHAKEIYSMLDKMYRFIL